MTHDTTTSPKSTPGFFAPDMVVRGRVEGQGDVLLAGRFDGEIHLDGVAEISPTGRIVGPVHARRAVVGGVVQGDVAAVEVLIQAGGRVLGDVRAERVALEDGAVLDGVVQMAVQFPEDFGQGESS